VVAVAECLAAFRVLADKRLRVKPLVARKTESGADASAKSNTASADSSSSASDAAAAGSTAVERGGAGGKCRGMKSLSAEQLEENTTRRLMD